MSLFGAVLGLAGGLLGARSQRREAARTREFNSQQTDPAFIRERYEAAGFNPLLGLGGPVIPVMTPQIGSTIANALTVAGENIDAHVQQKQQRQALEQENQRLQKQLEKSIMQPVVPGIYGKKGNGSSQNTGLDSSGSGPSGDDAGRTNRVAGVNVSQHEAFSDAEDIEQRYGDVLSSVYGIGVVGADAIETTNKAIEKSQRPIGWRANFGRLPEVYKSDDKKPRSTKRLSTPASAYSSGTYYPTVPAYRPNYPR